MNLRQGTLRQGWHDRQTASLNGGWAAGPSVRGAASARPMLARAIVLTTGLSHAGRPLVIPLHWLGETPYVFVAGLHPAECTIAERLMRVANGTLPWPWIDPDKALPWVEERIGLVLAESQVAAIRLALMS